MWLEVLLVGSCVVWRAAALSHPELLAANEWKCGGKGSCEGKAESFNSKWLECNCQCDKECPSYGDCCLDSPYFELSQQRRAAASVSCVNLRHFGGIYMRTNCPPDWDGPSTRAACETASENIRDPLAGFPATDNSTGITYRNYFCAICHRAEEQSYIWQPRVECELPGNLSLIPQNVPHHISFNGKERSWGLNLNNTFYRCAIVPLIPPQNPLTRQCVPNVIKTCLGNWKNVDISDRCDAYTSLVYLCNGYNCSVYRNNHCAECNNVNSSFHSCIPMLQRKGYQDYTKKVDLKYMITLDDNNGFIEFIQSLLKNTKPKRVDIYNHSTTNSKCKNVYQEEIDFVFREDTDTLHAQKQGIPYITDNRMGICSSDEERFSPNFNPYRGYITIVGLGISTVFLVLHLTNFCLVPELRNLFGKNLASLCVSLLMGYISILIGPVLQGTSCFIVAIIKCYAFLAAFTWMLTMAFDVWRTLRLATAKLRVSSGKQWRKFIAYSLWSWLFPAWVVLMALWVEQTTGVDTDLRPGFNSSSCWFSHSMSLITFFVGPLAVVMLLNITFFAFSAHMIYTTTNTTSFTSSAGTQRDFRLYLRLVVLMGLTWWTGLVARVLNIDFLWNLFVLLNTFQGLFIFLAFTYSHKIIQLTKTLVWGLLVPDRKRQFIPISSTSNLTRESPMESRKLFD